MIKVKFNYSLKVYNAFELDIDYDKACVLVAPFLEDLNRLELYHPKKKSLHLHDLPHPLYAQIPHWNGDISWISAASKETFNFFEQCFTELGIARKTQEAAELDFPLMMYSGFFVVRSYGEETHFHLDYDNACENKAFTLMLPIQIDETAEFGHLLFKNAFFTDDKYRYTKGKAISFGSTFVHSTEPFKSDEKFIFLCFTYGTKDIGNWEAIQSTVTRQGISYRHPDGNIRVTDRTFEHYF